MEVIYIVELEKKIAEGRNNVVYQSGELAVKVFNEDYPKADVFSEALITSQIENIGLNIPKVREVSVVDGKWALAMDYIPGKTIEQLMQENPEKKEEYLEMLVDLQIEMQSKTCPILKKLKDKLNSRINGLTELDEGKKYELLTRLDSAPKHKKVCHGDFTPQNVIISEKDGQPYIIDWNHATIGNASADVARSYLWLSLYMPDIANKYMEMFCSKTNTDKVYVQKWLPIVAAARLWKGIPEEKDLIMKWTDVVEYQ